MANIDPPARFVRDLATPWVLGAAPWLAEPEDLLPAGGWWITKVHTTDDWGWRPVAELHIQDGASGELADAIVAAFPEVPRDLAERLVREVKGI